LVDAQALCCIRLRHRFNDLVYRDRQVGKDVAGTSSDGCAAIFLVCHNSLNCLLTVYIQ
jgi:hypothetical protein